MFCSFQVAETHQASMLKCCWTLSTVSLVLQNAASSL
ncbi:hypothetical protein A51_021323 [Vibrio cholerae MZO-3]|nr:hypothetical protein A51_021323 [Vibrio cholerae MZO-3]